MTGRFTGAVETNYVSPDILLTFGVVIGVSGMVLTVFVKNIRWKRRIYWVSWLLATSLMSLAFLDRGWPSVLLAAGICAGMACMYAYLRTSYLKIGGRIYAFTIVDGRPDPSEKGSPPHPIPDPPPDAYRNFLTAPKFWWTLAVFGCAAGLSALELGMSGTTLGLTALAGGMLALIGHFDAREGFPIARRQFIQLAVIVLASIPVFLVPPLAYVMTYWAAGGSFRFSYRDKDDA